MLLCESLCICDVVRIFHDSLVKPYHFGVQMKKLVLASAVISTLVVTGCSSTSFSSDYPVKKPLLPTVTPVKQPNTTVNNQGTNKPVTPPNTNTSVNTPTIVAHKNAIDLNDIKEELENKWESKIVDLKMQVKNADNRADKINLAPLGQGFSMNDWSATVVEQDLGQTYNMEYKGKLYLFQQDYSALGIMTVTHETENGDTAPIEPSLMHQQYTHYILDGQPTTNLPTKGTYNYAGKVKIHDVNRDKYLDNRMIDGQFNYAVNFDTQTGSGKVSNIDGKDIKLNAGRISDLKDEDGFKISPTVKGIEGTATHGNKTGEYTLGFFGPNANEVSGTVTVETGENTGYMGIIGGKKQ